MEEEVGSGTPVGPLEKTLQRPTIQPWEMHWEPRKVENYLTTSYTF